MVVRHRHSCDSDQFDRPDGHPSHGVCGQLGFLSERGSYRVGCSGGDLLLLAVLLPFEGDHGL